MDKDEGYQAGRNELEQHVRAGRSDWGEYNSGEEPPKKGGCGKPAATAVLLFLSGVAAAYAGARYGTTV